MTSHLRNLIRNLTDAELIERVAAFAHSDDDTMRGLLISEAKRRGL